MSIFETMARVELPKRSRFRAGLGSFLQNHRRQSDVLFRADQIVLGRKCPAAEISLGAPMVSQRTRFDFSDRVRFALGPDRRTHRLRRHYSDRRLSSSRARSTRRPRVFDVADALLVHLERRLRAFSMWRRSSVVVIADFLNRVRAFARWT